MRRHFYLTVSLIGLLLASCGKQENTQMNDSASNETATSGNFQLVADEVLKPVIDSLVHGYMSECPDAHVTVKYVSAGEAVRELMNHEARAIIIDRYMTAQEQALFAKDSTSMPEYKMAEDGIGCIVSSSNLQSTIRLSDLKTMVSSEGGSLTKIFPAYPSSVESVLDSVAGTQQTKGYLQRYSTTDSLLTRVAGDAKTIGFTGCAWQHYLDAKNDTSVKFLPVIPHDLSSQGVSEPVLLHIAYIAEGVYPLTTMVMGYTSELANTVPRGFFAYTMTAHGQTVFKNFGIVPKTQPLKLVPAK